MKQEMISLSTKDGPMNVFVAHPKSQKEIPAILVFQEAFGVNSHIQNVCKRFADEGYLAIAPEFFHREGKALRIQCYYGQQEAPGNPVHVFNLT